MSNPILSTLRFVLQSPNTMCQSCTEKVFLSGPSMMFRVCTLAGNQSKIRVQTTKLSRTNICSFSSCLQCLMNEAMSNVMLKTLLSISPKKSSRSSKSCFAIFCSDSTASSLSSEDWTVSLIFTCWWVDSLFFKTDRNSVQVLDRFTASVVEQSKTCCRSLSKPQRSFSWVAPLPCSCRFNLLDCKARRQSGLGKFDKNPVHFSQPLERLGFVGCWYMWVIGIVHTRRQSVIPLLALSVYCAYSMQAVINKSFLS